MHNVDIEQVHECREARFMQKAKFKHLIVPRLAALTFLVAAAGCSTSGGDSAGTVSKQTNVAQPRITQSELEAYCPKISLREGTAFYNNYEKGGDQDSERVIYQASLADVTRDCHRNGGMLNIKIAAAGRVVPGPKFKPGTITMPIRVVVMQGETVAYSHLYKHPVAVQSAQSATQFLFNVDNVSLPEPTSRNVLIMVGFDEGPYNTK